MVVLMIGVLQVKAHTHDNHRLLSYHNNGFCDTTNHYHTIDTIAYH